MKTDADFPRTLIVGAQFSEQSGTGTFLARLFSGWPQDRFATVFGGSLAPDWQRCRRYYRTGDQEFRLRGPFNKLVPATASGPVVEPAMVARPTIVTPQTISRGRRLARYPWRALLRLLGGAEILYTVGPSPQLLAWICDLQPEVLYGHCSGLNSIRFLRQMRQALNLPLVLHCMDDWPETLYRNGLASRFLRKRYLAEFSELVHSADVVIAICKEMADEYQNRYHREVLWLPMPVDLRAYRTSARAEWGAGKPFRLLYGGRVGWAIRECLADIGKAVHALRQRGMDVTFDIMTAEMKEVPAICRTLSGVNVYPLRPLAELSRTQAEADLLVVCYDFDTESYKQAKYSMPAKLAACMAAGTPILVYGPAGLPVVEYARREGWGKVVDRQDASALQTSLCELMESENVRERFGRTAQRMASELHDAKIVSERIRSILVAAIGEEPTLIAKGNTGRCEQDSRKKRKDVLDSSSSSTHA